MSEKKVIIRPEAESDTNDAYQWYEAQRKGLGEDFLLCIEEALSRASRNPAIYSVVHKEVRRVLIHRFPFGVFSLAVKEVSPSWLSFMLVEIQKCGKVAHNKAYQLENKGAKNKEKVEKREGEKEGVKNVIRSTMV